jgi:alkylation response protein AidB-like acyl-CoA dehydrogenase
MALVWNQEQEMLRDSARAFLTENAPVSHLRKLRDARDETGFSRDLWRNFAEMGFTGVLIPEAHGGLGLGHVEAGVIIEEMGHTLTPSPFFSTAVLAASAFNRAGTEAQQAKYLPNMAAGNLVVALATDEASKHRPLQIGLQANAVDNGFVLNGEKILVIDGHVADLLIVSARTFGAPGDAAGVTLFLIEPGAAGVKIERTVMVDAHNAARIKFDNVRVSADAVLGQRDQGGKILEQVLDVGRAAIAAELVGVADEAFSRTLTYLKERRQFNALIGEFQALQHRASHLYTEIEITRAAVLRALQMLEEAPHNAAATVSMAKARAGTTATLAVQEGVQMHGGIGMTDEFEMGFFMKRARVLQELLGDANFHADRLARINGY